MAERNAHTLRVASGPLAASVLQRVIGALSAGADLPIDRLSDASLIAETLGRSSGESLDDGVQVVVIVEPGAVELRVGPLRAGGARALLDESTFPDVGSVIEGLGDRVWTTRDDEGERLHIRVQAAPLADARS